MMVINFVFSICMFMLLSTILPDLFFIDITESYLAVESTMALRALIDIDVYTLYRVRQSGKSGLQSFS